MFDPWVRVSGVERAEMIRWRQYSTHETYLDEVLCVMQRAGLVIHVVRPVVGCPGWYVIVAEDVT